MSQTEAVALLLDARLWIARLGELDVLGWWRTDGILGSEGAFVGPRVLPLTHPTGRARIAFGVAAHACGERHPDPAARHLFRLDPELEDRLDGLLAARLSDRSYWGSMMPRLEAVGRGASCAHVLRDAGVVGAEDVALAGRLPLGPGGRSVAVPAGADEVATIRRLTAAFTRSDRGGLAVPYVAGRNG